MAEVTKTKKTPAKKTTGVKKTTGAKKSSTTSSTVKKKTTPKKTATKKETVVNKKVVNEKAKAQTEALERTIAINKIEDKPENQPTTKMNYNIGSIGKFHFSFQLRMFVYILVLIMFIVSTFAFLKKSFNYKEGEVVTYKENYNLDYSVKLKPNSIYETSELGKNMAYIASLIDSINVDYNYTFNIDKESNVKISYYTYAVLSITNADGKSYFSKEYQLSKPEEVILNNEKTATINKKINIDYGYYNNLANQFKTTYGISTESNLKVYLKINKINLDENTSINFVASEPFALEIPLSEKTVNINMNYKDVNENNEVLSNQRYDIIDKHNLTGALLFALLSICTLISMIRFIIKIQVKKSEYDQYVEKILREYDRLIVNTTSKPQLNTEKLVKVKEFNELLDVRDTLQLPIMYYEVTKHQKCYFYINQEPNLFLYQVKAIDLENKNTKR